MKYTAPLLAAFAIIALASAPVLRAEVVRPAPDFTFLKDGGRTGDLRSLRGQPVVLLVGKSPRDGAFRKQSRRLEESFRRFASRGAVFVAVFTEEGGEVRSNLPFVMALDGPAVASAYGSTGGFLLAVIGADGNLDLVTTRFHSAEMIRAVMENSYPVASKGRRWPAESDFATVGD